MKHIILLVILLAGCKKSSVNPTPIQTEKQRLFNFDVNGYLSNDKNYTVSYPDEYGNYYSLSCTLVDSCEIKINGILKYKSTRGYHAPLKSGDTVSVYIKGKVSNPLSNYFLFWEDKNAPIKSDTIFAKNGIIKGQIIIP